MILLNRISRRYLKYRPKHLLHHMYGLGFQEAIGNGICKTFLLININVCMIKQEKKKKKLEMKRNETRMNLRVAYASGFVQFR
jgi:hypothetical protein